MTREPNHQVNTLQPRAALAVLRRAGIPPEKVFQGIQLTEAELCSQPWISWKSFVEFSEKVEAELNTVGLADEFGRLAIEEWPFLSSLAGALVSPVQLLRTAFKMGNYAFPVLQASVNVRGDVIELFLQAPAEGQAPVAFYRQVASVWKYASTLLGLPPAEVTLNITGYDCHLLVKPPEVGTLKDRLERGIQGFSQQALGQLTSMMASPLEVDFPLESPLEERIKEIHDEWRLTERQSLVLSHVVQGKSNKQIAAELNCSERTVEVHVGQILRAQKVTNRGELIARFWANPL